MRPGPLSPSASGPSLGPTKRDAVGLQARAVALGRGVLPHPRVHGGRDEHRLVGRDQRRGREVVGDAVGHLGHDVGGRGRHHHDVGLLPEPDVGDLAVSGERERVGVDRLPGQGLDRERRDEFGAGTGQDAAHVRAVLPQPPDQVEALVGGDAARDHKQDALPRNAQRCGRPLRPRFPLPACDYAKGARASAARAAAAPLRASAPRAAATSGSPRCCRRSPARSACRGRRAG